MSETEDTPKLSWWRRLSSGLKRTSSSLGTAVADLVTKRKLDRAMLEDIEDVLLRADLGTEVAARIADAVGAGRKHDLPPLGGKSCRELADRGGLAGAVDAYDQDHDDRQARGKIFLREAEGHACGRRYIS